MKKSLYLYSFLALVTLCFFSSCDEDESEQERVQNLLTSGGAWNLQSATVDGVDRSGTYDGLTITFTGSNFSTTHGGVLWPASGTWKFSEGSASEVVRNDGMVFTIASISATTLQLDFTWDETTYAQGRASSVSGDHSFLFTRP